MVAGALSLISITLGWWGANGPLGYSVSLGLFGVTPSDPILSQEMLVFLGFVVTTAIVGLFGSVYRRTSILLLGAFMLSLVTAILFGVVLNNTMIAECRASGSSTCINGLVGSSPADGVTWGFQAGFYLFIASGLLFVVENMPLANITKEAGTVSKNKYCSECGSAVSVTAKFCSNCATPLHFT